MNPNLQPTDLFNDFVKLVPLQQNDFDALYAVACDPLIWEQHPNPDRYKKEIFENYFKGAMESGGAMLIKNSNTNEIIGSSRFYDFDAEKNCINIGSAGGWTKASTGYTFKNATKKSKALIEFMKSESDFTRFHKIDKFWLYDLLLLDILSSKNELGSTIFSALFTKGNATVIFKFLDEETTFLEDLRVIWKCPKKIFIQALLKRLFSL